MKLELLQLYQFKNYSEASLRLTEDLVVLTGHNGAGKTNLLDAICLLCTGRSAFGSKEADLVLNTGSQMMVKGELLRKEEKVPMSFGWNQGKKSHSKKGLPVGKMAEHLGYAPVVMVAPNDTDLIRGGPELRRRFFDQLFSQTDRSYLEGLIGYHQLLKQRNAFLKQVYQWKETHLTLLDSYDSQMLPLILRLSQARQNHLAGFLELFLDYYEKISQKEEKVSLHLESQGLAEDFPQRWRAQQQKDRERERTMLGAHRDEYHLAVGNLPARGFASQGQQKSLLLAMKLAEYDQLASQLELKPFLLLDDVFDRLDPERLEHLLAMVVRGHFGQVWISDTDPARVPERLKSLGQNFHHVAVDQGSLNLLQ